MACRSGCKTQDHVSYAACCRAANTKIDMHMQGRQRTATELAAYKAARDAGIQPAGTTQRMIDAANAASDSFGGAFNSEDNSIDGKPIAEIVAGA